MQYAVIKPTPFRMVQPAWAGREVGLMKTHPMFQQAIGPFEPQPSVVAHAEASAKAVAVAEVRP